MEFVHFITQDAKHFWGFMFVAWLAFEGAESLIKAWRGRS